MTRLGDSLMTNHRRFLQSKKADRVKRGLISAFVFLTLPCFAQQNLQMQLECGLERIEDRFGSQKLSGESLEAMGFPPTLFGWVQEASQDPLQQELAVLHQAYVDAIAGQVSRIDQSENENQVNENQVKGLNTEEDPLGFQIKEIFSVSLISYDGPEGQKRFQRILLNICSEIASHLGSNLTNQCVESTIKKMENLNDFLKSHLSASKEYAELVLEGSEVWNRLIKDDENACPGKDFQQTPDKHRFSRDVVTNTNLCYGLVLFLKSNRSILTGRMIDQEGITRGRVLIMQNDGKAMEAYAAPFSLISNSLVLNPAFFTVFGGNADSWNKIVESAIGPFRMTF